MGTFFSKPVPKPSRSTLLNSTSRTVNSESSDNGKVKSKRDSAECRAFRKCFSVLADGITDPGWLAVQLYSSELIGPDIRKEAQKQAIGERVKIEMLLSAVEDQIMASPASKFREFLVLLQNEPSLQHLVAKLKTTHHELLGVIPKSTLSTLPIDTYASYLKFVYTREKLPIYDKWPQVKSKKYINLALIEKEGITKLEADQFTRATIHGNIDDIKMSKRGVDIHQIAQLQDGSESKCILVEGAPGVGKSTLAWKLCRKWGEGILLQQYKLVVLLRLRDKGVQAAMNIFDLFRYYDYQIRQAVVEEVKKTRGKGVLLLFEGYDELPEELRSENSVFLDVITGRELPDAIVLVTSCPWASEFLHRECKRCISQHIEILGFTKDNVQFYLESTINNDPSLLADLKKYISCYPHINSLMYIPLNSAIVVEVYQNSRKDETLVPKTMTELYSSLVRSLLLRYLLDHPVHGKKRRWRVRSFSDLPQDVYQQLCELGRIAYEGISHRQQVIFTNLPEDFETLGLMHCTPELYVDEGAVVSYNFLHLTVQEYLAAFHLSQQPVEKQIEHFREYKGCKRQDMHMDHKQHHFHMVLQFMCGIRKFIGYPSEVLSTLCINKYGSDSANVIHISFNTLHWLFETRDNDVLTKVLGSAHVQLHKQLYSRRRYNQVTPFDCFVLGYCVSQSNCMWSIDLADSHIGNDGVELLMRGAVEEETHSTGGISTIVLWRNDITSKGMKDLLGFPKQLLNRLKVIDLFSNKLDSESCAALAHLIPHMPYLKKLKLSQNPNIGHGRAVPLITSLTALNSLEEMGLTHTGFDVEDCQALCELLSSSTRLKKLEIAANALPPEAVELIISGLHHNTTIETLNMSDSYFSLKNTISLASVLRTNHPLVDLNLSNCKIDSDGACQFSSALCINKKLQMLNMERNPIGNKGATAFAEMLFTNKSLKELNLAGNSTQDNSICEESIQKLIDSLTHNTTVRLGLPMKYESLIADSCVLGRVTLNYATTTSPPL